MRSVDVVFPASMCAMIPMLRVSSSLNTRAILSFQVPLLRNSLLPPVMRERLVRFRHAVHVFLLLHRSAARIRRIDQLIRELVHHRLARAFPRILQQPANRQRLPAERIHFHRNLVVRAAHAPRFHFQQRLHVLDGLLEDFQRIVVGLLRHLIHRAVKHALRRRFLAFPHHRADELLHNVAGIDRIGRLRSPENESFAWHCSLSLLRKSFHAQPLTKQLPYFAAAALGRFAPYFDRPCLRFSTPAASSVPRTMWYRTPGKSFTRPPRTSTIECSCRLWPTPGMYVVTSIAFVRRTRATLRKAEFGFFGVCVYTRMHTPRFSGQPASAGDFVLAIIPSRPILTNCENVGTVVPQSRAENFHPREHPATDALGIRGSRSARRQIGARAQSSAERSTANPENS